MPKASAREFHQPQKASCTKKPSVRFPTTLEGLRRLRPEPTPSPRPWVARQARPRLGCANIARMLGMSSQNRNFLLWWE